MSLRTVDHVLMSLPYKWSNNISDYNQSQLVSTKCPLTSRLFPSWKNRTFRNFRILSDIDLQFDWVSLQFLNFCRSWVNQTITLTLTFAKFTQNPPIYTYWTENWTFAESTSQCHHVRGLCSWSKLKCKKFEVQ